MKNNYALRITNLRGRRIFVYLIFLLTICGLSQTAQAQRRDHLNAMEIEIVRDAQELDLRSAVFIKAIDRRFLVLNNQAAPTDKKSKAADEKWGELPTGTTLELLLDIEGILQEAIDNIDNVAERDQNSPLFPKAVRILAGGATRILPQLDSRLEKTADEKEKGALLGAIDSCRQIIDSVAKLPKDAPKEEKKEEKKKSKKDSE